MAQASTVPVRVPPNHALEPTAHSVRCAPAIGGGSPQALARLSEATRHVGSLARAIRGVLVTSKSWSYAQTCL